MKISDVEIIEKGDMVCEHTKRKCKPFEPSSLQTWGEIAKKQGTMLDIGSYTGLYAIKAAKLGSKAYAFEPNVKSFTRLKENAAANKVNLIAINTAIGNEMGKKCLFKKFDLSSAATITESRGEPVDIITVDSLNLSDVTGMKIDVEGYEKNVLLGALATIKKCKPVIICEILNDKAQKEQAEILEPIGYWGSIVDERNIIWRHGSTADYWKSEGLLHIIPPDTEAPEGFDVHGELAKLFKGRSVLEIGCGRGRLCSAFNTNQYIGYDINERAIKLAKDNNPEYYFTTDKIKSDNVLLYTVLLHISDKEIQAFIDDLTAKYVVIAEIMGRQWRRAGAPPVFNREKGEYTELFKKAGYTLTETKDYDYSHYKNTKITFMVFEK